MKTKTKVFIGIAAVTYAYEVVSNIVLNKRIATVRDIGLEACELLDKRTKLVNFYADKLNKYDVPLDDFDIIVMNELTD